jgi:fatty acid desaturase
VGHGPRPLLKSVEGTENLRTIEDKQMRPDRRALAVYLAAAAVYVALGVVLPELLLSWIVGVAYLLVAVWLVPAVARRLR